jgi:hypothetical protein
LANNGRFEALRLGDTAQLLEPAAFIAGVIGS